MARYCITYDNGHDETVTATDVDLDTSGDQYRFRDANGRTIALVPRGNVLSIILTEEPTAVTG
jgi:hypothetical protein